MKGFGAEAVDTAMRRLVELGYLDDSSFAKGLVRRRSALRGPRALSAELAARGIDRTEADSAVAEFDIKSQLISATRLAERLCARKAGIGYREMLDSVGTKLIRRGFSAHVVREACRLALSGAAQLPED
jgi:regulatory protein